jgi:hypothetical protein
VHIPISGVRSPRPSPCVRSIGPSTCERTLAAAALLQLRPGTSCPIPLLLAPMVSLTPSRPQAPAGTPRLGSSWSRLPAPRQQLLRAVAGRPAGPAPTRELCPCPLHELLYGRRRPSSARTKKPSRDLAFRKVRKCLVGPGELVPGPSAPSCKPSAPERELGVHLVPK